MKEADTFGRAWHVTLDGDEQITSATGGIVRPAQPPGVETPRLRRGETDRGRLREAVTPPNRLMKAGNLHRQRTERRRTHALTGFNRFRMN
jgi:hypothetical protein